MKVFLATIALLGALGAGPKDQAPTQPHHHDHGAECVTVVARASQYRAVCSKGDLNAVFGDRAAAVQAAQNHQRSTGHATSVVKQ